MKNNLIICSLFLLTAAPLSFAANEAKGGVSFPNAVRIGNQSLPAGRYEVHWQPGASDAPVTISGNGHKISVPAKLASAPGPDVVDMHASGKDQVVDGFTTKSTSFTITTPTTP
jgi:hypothetical protein